MVQKSNWKKYLDFSTQTNFCVLVANLKMKKKVFFTCRCQYCLDNISLPNVPLVNIHCIDFRLIFIYLFT